MEMSWEKIFEAYASFTFSANFSCKKSSEKEIRGEVRWHQTIKY